MLVGGHQPAYPCLLPTTEPQPWSLLQPWGWGWTVTENHRRDSSHPEFCTPFILREWLLTTCCACVNDSPPGEMGEQGECHAHHKQGGTSRISMGRLIRQLFFPCIQYHAAFVVHKYDSKTIQDLGNQRIVEANSTVLMKTHFRKALSKCWNK